MRVNKVRIQGFANIENIDYNLNKLNALIALNNYGKSNVLKAFDFAFEYISSPPDVRDKMMSYKPYIPFNKHIENKPFVFEVDMDLGSLNVLYSFSFDWIKTISAKGKQIVSETLRIKNKETDTRYTSYIKRNHDNAHYLPSETGRCDRVIKVGNNELVLNKLFNFDELFYWNVLSEINSIKIAQIDTLQKPDELFRRIRPSRKRSNIIREDFSLKMDDLDDSAYFIYSLKQKELGFYELFKDAILTLLPAIEDFEPIEIDLKNKFRFDNEEKDLPINFPERVYDIRIKEKNNNQQTSIVELSSGSQKLFYIISVLIASELNKIPIVLLEELENSIHPGLMQKLLIVMDNLLSYPKLVFSSHSPYLIQYLNYESIEIGVPNQLGLAEFKKLRSSKYSKVLAIAEEESVSIGDFLFERMIEDEEESFFHEMCEK